MGRVGVHDILSGVMTVRKFGEPGQARQFSNMHQTGQNGIYLTLFIHRQQLLSFRSGSQIKQKGKAPA
jgi:hypothetical protein